MYRKILVPLDGSELAECALGHVQELIRGAFDGEVILLNAVVADIPWRAINEGEEGHSITFDINTIVKSCMEKARRYLAKVKYRFASGLRAEGASVRTEAIESERPSRAIAEYAREHNVDLIVIATHGYTGMKKMMLGSTALRVLSESNVPVLLIRPESCRI